MAYFKSYRKSYGGLGWLATGPVRKGNKDFPRGKITHQSEITYRGKFRIITNSRYIKYCKKNQIFPYVNFRSYIATTDLH